MREGRGGKGREGGGREGGKDEYTVEVFVRLELQRSKEQGARSKEQ